MLFQPTKNYFMTILSIQHFNTIMRATGIAFSLLVGRILFCHRYWTGHGHAIFKHCKLIFWEFHCSSWKYSVVDLIKHINEWPLLFSCNWSGKKQAIILLMFYVFWAKGMPFSCFASSYSVQRTPLLQPIKFICLLAIFSFFF